MTVAEKLIKIDENMQKVFEAGRQAEYDAFWDALQANGTRENYEYAFSRWEAEYVRPKRKVVPTSRSIYMFSHNSQLKKVESQYFDLSKGSCGFGLTEGHYRTFENCISLEEVEDIGMKAGYYYATWQRCHALKKISVVRASEESVFNDPFIRCDALEEIRFEGTIANNISFKDSPLLTSDSAWNIAQHLKDFSTSDEAEHYTRYITLPQAVWDRLYAEQSPSVWGYIDNKKWSIVSV